MKKITISISPVGDVKVETKGFSGSTCKAETAEFEKSLGKTTRDKPTGEAYHNEQNYAINRG
jgi:hypothetical protein